MSGHRHLSIKVKEAKGIPAADSNGKSDPYVVLTIGGQKKKTKIIHKTLEPKWYEDFRFDIDDSQHVLRFEVFDHDKFSKDDSLGYYELNLKTAHIPIGQWTPFTRNLIHDKVSGEIQFEIHIA
jgi:Ca2+-dependent lipid-binding protein